MKKFNEDLTKFIQKHWIESYFCAALMLAVVVNIGMNLPIASLNASLEAPTWLGFWGSYLGGAIGCLPAIAAYRRSIDESKRQIEKEEANRRLSVRPILNLSSTPLERSFHALPHIFFSTAEGFKPMSSQLSTSIDIALHDSPQKGIKICIKNLGFGHALNVKLSYFGTVHYLGTIEQGSSTDQLFYLSNFKIHAWEKPSQLTAITFSIFLTYEDVFCNEYKQTINLILFSDEYSVVSDIKPVLIKRENIDA